MSFSSSGLRPDKVDAGHNEAYFNAQCKRLFEYDDTIVPNSNQPMQPTRSCFVATWGLCTQDPLVLKCMNAAWNLPLLLKTWGVTRTSCPRFVTVAATEGAPPSSMLLCDMLGTGSTQLFVYLECICDDEFRILTERADGRDIAKCSTTQMVVRRMLMQQKELDSTFQPEEARRLQIGVYDVSADVGAKSLKLRRGALVKSGSVQLTHKLQRLKGEAKDVTKSEAAKKLPFGLSMTASGDFDDDDMVEKAVHPSLAHPFVHKAAATEEGELPDDAAKDSDDSEVDGRQ